MGGGGNQYVPRPPMIKTAGFLASAMMNVFVVPAAKVSKRKGGGDKGKKGRGEERGREGRRVVNR